MRQAFRISTIFFLSALVSATASADSNEDRYAVLVAGTGSYSRPIDTRSDLAQRFFDQGLRLMYGYYMPEAIASHLEALRHDPDNPMIYCGLALASGPNRRMTGSRTRAAPASRSAGNTRRSAGRIAGNVGTRRDDERPRTADSRSTAWSNRGATFVSGCSQRQPEPFIPSSIPGGTVQFIIGG